MNNKNCYVFKITQADAMSLKALLEERLWEFSLAPYTFYKAAGPKVSIAAYESGKLVIQGEGASEFVEFTLEPLILKERAFDGSCNLTKGQTSAQPQKEFSPHAGIDESGKGDFFGPLVIACAFIPDAASEKVLQEAGVRDSKQIKSDAVMLKTSTLIRNTLKGAFEIVVIGPEAYNRIYERSGNLNRLLAWGHAQALEGLVKKRPDCTRAIADQFADESLVRNAFARFGHHDFKLEQMPRAEADTAVAAASILARAEFVRRVKLLEERVGSPLPKGAGPGVDQVARQLALSGGADLLRTVAKMHFRTAFRALGLPEPEKKEWNRHS